MTMNKQNLNKLIAFYRKELEFFFIATIDKEALGPLANMLALHYLTKNEEEHTDLAAKAIIRLRKYLNSRVIIEYDFSVVLGLFTIAITDNDNYSEDITETIKQAQDKNAVINQIINELGDNNFKLEIRSFLEKIIPQANSDEIINYIVSNKKKTKDIYLNLEQHGLKGKDQIHKELLNILRKEALIKRNSDLYKNSLSMAGIIVSGAAIAASSIVGLGLLAPLAIVPATIYGIRACSIPIEYISNSIINVISSFSNKDAAINKQIEKNISLTQAITNKIDQTSISKTTMKEVSNIVNNLHIENVNQAKVKKEHSQEIINKANAIKDKITQRQI